MTVQRIGVYYKLKDKSMIEEYKRRHDEIWPEVKQALYDAGYRNYSIWNYEEKLFGYFEVEDLEKANAIVAASPRYAEWRDYMEEIIAIDENGQKEYFMDLCFLHDPK